MGNAAIYYHPSLDSQMTVIDLGEGWSDIQAEPVYGGSFDRAISGRGYRLVEGGYWRVRLLCEMIDSASRAALIRSLRTLEAHLKNGRVVGVTQDTAKAWAAFADFSLPGTSTQIQCTGGSPFWAPAAAIAAADEIWIESQPPESNKEIGVVSAVLGNRITLATGLLYSHKAKPVLVRHNLYWPVMRLAREAMNRPIITSDRGNAWTLDLLLEEDSAGLAAFAAAGGAPIKGVAGTGDTADGRIEATVRDSSGRTVRVRSGTVR
jgi:hypothetical protein